MNFEINFIMNDTRFSNEIILGNPIKVTVYYDYIEYLIKNQEFINESTKNIFKYFQCLIFQICFILIALNLLKLSFFLFKSTSNEKNNITQDNLQLNVYYDINDNTKRKNKKKIACILTITAFLIIIISWYIFQI